ncbi:hypothetical protein B1757_02350 [Acidithiobacillus marinus]|uniref:Uncharacterized protein n=1 Tax=Acidithiobacillus marinus TaxID=187490 RepID=A0A2I1DPP7_9PROT|nr:hypothetical protein [Acidithiobacillus marinus]PKY11822.1 hypothetical protein B1757_02350 [Acidithiobacillus marinus]
MGVPVETHDTQHHKRISRTQQYFSTRREWLLPDILINPIGTLVIWEDGWKTAPWLESFMQAVRDIMEYDDLRTMISLPIRQNVAEYWDLVMLTSGLSNYFGIRSKPTLWPMQPPVSSILAMDQVAWPGKIKPELYIDCIPERMIETLKMAVELPEKVIYWRPSQKNIQAMESFDVVWNDVETDLLDFPEVKFAGQPEDVIAILGGK